MLPCIGRLCLIFNLSNAGHLVERADAFCDIQTISEDKSESEDKLLFRSETREHNEGLRGIIIIGLGDSPGETQLESSSFPFSSEKQVECGGNDQSTTEQSVPHSLFLTFSLLYRTISLSGFAFLYT